MSTKIQSVSFFLLFAVSQAISTPLTLTGEENALEKLKLNPLLISKMDPVLQFHFKNKDSNQQLILAVNQLEASLQNLYVVLDSQNEEMKKGLNGKRFTRQDDEEEPELLIQIGQILGSIFSGGFRESIVQGGREAIKRRFEGLVQSKPTTKAPAKN